MHVTFESLNLMGGDHSKGIGLDRMIILKRKLKLILYVVPIKVTQDRIH
jgi:hypothetical protein